MRRHQDTHKQKERNGHYNKVRDRVEGELKGGCAERPTHIVRED